jgi:DNA polymerase III subunit beta
MTTYPQKELSDALGLASRVVATQSPVEVAKCARLSLSEKGFSVSATDFEAWISISSKGFVAKDAEVAVVPCERLYSVISAMPKDASIGFSISGKRITMKSGPSKYSFGLLPVEDWPEVPWNEKGEEIITDSEQLAHTLGFAASSMGKKELRHYLNGVNIRPGVGKCLRLIGCDGHRIANNTIPLGKKSGIKQDGIIIADKIVRLYEELISRIDGEEAIKVSLEVTESKCRFEMKDDFKVVVTSKLIDGQFPNVEQVVNYKRTNQATFEVPRLALLEILKRAQMLSDPMKGSPVKLDFGDGKLKVTAKCAEGDAEEVLKIDGKGKPLCASFNARYVADALDIFGGEKIFFIFGDGDHNIEPVFVVEGEDQLDQDGRYAYIMPMRGD